MTGDVDAMLPVTNHSNGSLVEVFPAGGVRDGNGSSVPVLLPGWREEITAEVVITASLMALIIVATIIGE